MNGHTFKLFKSIVLNDVQTKGNGEINMTSYYHTLKCIMILYNVEGLKKYTFNESHKCLPSKNVK